MEIPFPMDFTLGPPTNPQLVPRTKQQEMGKKVITVHAGIANTTSRDLCVSPKAHENPLLGLQGDFKALCNS
jgi:hypothetical protein